MKRPKTGCFFNVSDTHILFLPTSWRFTFLPTIRSHREACEFRTRCREARPGGSLARSRIRSSLSEGTVPRSRGVNPTRLTCRNEPDSDYLCRDGAFISDDVDVVATGVNKRHPRCVHARRAVGII
jgi:hypothetical protein